MKDKKIAAINALAVMTAMCIGAFSWEFIVNRK